MTTTDLWVLYDIADTLTQGNNGSNNADLSMLSSLRVGLCQALTLPLEEDDANFL